MFSSLLFMRSVACEWLVCFFEVKSGFHITTMFHSPFWLVRRCRFWTAAPTRVLKTVNFYRKETFTFSNVYGRSLQCNRFPPACKLSHIFQVRFARSPVNTTSVITPAHRWLFSSNRSVLFPTSRDFNTKGFIHLFLLRWRQKFLLLLLCRSQQTE